jgi:hypothetical protein
MTEKIGQTDTEKWAADMLVCRQITNEVISFGVSQRQLLNIIKLLAMELEHRDALVAISEVVKEALEEAKNSNIILE